MLSFNRVIAVLPVNLSRTVTGSCWFVQMPQANRNNSCSSKVSGIVNGAVLRCASWMRSTLNVVNASKTSLYPIT